MRTEYQSAVRYQKKLRVKMGRTLSFSLLSRMVQNYARCARIQSLIDQKVRTVLAAHPVLPVQRVAYLCYGRQVGALLRRHTGKTLKNELRLIRMRWEARGLDPAVLEALEKAVRNVLP